MRRIQEVIQERGQGAQRQKIQEEDPEDPERETQTGRRTDDSWSAVSGRLWVGSRKTDSEEDRQVIRRKRKDPERER